jgi:excisionase family DNA binding protein
VRLLGAVQRYLGHSSPEITAAVNDHSGQEDFRADVDRALTFGVPVRVNAPVMQGAEMAKNEGPEASAFARNLGAFHESGRLDLNQRPLAPQACPNCESNNAGSGKCSQSGEFSEEALSAPSPSLGGLRRSFHAPVMQDNVTVGADLLLTVKEAARRLEVSTATVYSLCESGRLPHVRISTHSIRILRADLAGFVRSCLHEK